MLLRARVETAVGRYRHSLDIEAYFKGWELPVDRVVGSNLSHLCMIVLWRQGGLTDATIPAPVSGSQNSQRWNYLIIRPPDT